MTTKGLTNVLSVDDLVGGLFKLQSSTNMGIGRTDSEAAFQEFLKRIPSATNMANIAGSSGQLAPPGPLDNGSAYSSMGALPATDVAGSSAGLGGIPRVSSLDFLARLVSQPQFNAPAASTSSPVVPPSNPVKLEPGPGGVCMVEARQDVFSC